MLYEHLAQILIFTHDVKLKAPFNQQSTYFWSQAEFTTFVTRFHDFTSTKTRGTPIASASPQITLAEFREPEPSRITLAEFRSVPNPNLPRARFVHVRKMTLIAPSQEPILS